MSPERAQEIVRYLKKDGPKFKPTRKHNQIRTLLYEMRKCRTLIEKDATSTGSSHSLHLNKMFALINQAAAIFDSMPALDQARTPKYVLAAVGRPDRFPSAPDEMDVFDLGFSTFRDESGNLLIVIGDTIYGATSYYKVDRCGGIPPESHLDGMLTSESDCEKGEDDR